MGRLAQGSLWPAHSVLKDGDLTSIVSKPVAVTCQLSAQHMEAIDPCMFN